MEQTVETKTVERGFNPSQKHEYTTTKAVIAAFNAMPDRFFASELIELVRKQGIKDFDSTILRMLRRVREQGRISSWKCIDSKCALYEKENNFTNKKN